MLVTTLSGIKWVKVIVESIFIRIAFEDYFKDYIANELSSSSYSFVDLTDLPSCLKSQDEYLQALKQNPLDEYMYDAVEEYCGWSFEFINRYLRGLSVRADRYDLAKEKLPFLEKAIAKSSIPISQNICVVRRLSKNGFKSMIRFPSKGMEFSDAGFMSTSLNPFYRLDIYSDKKPLLNEVLLLLKIPKDVIALYIPNWVSKNQRNEDELIINKGSKFTIEHVKKIKTNLLVVATFDM